MGGTKHAWGEEDMQGLVGGVCWGIGWRSNREEIHRRRGMTRREIEREPEDPASDIHGAG